MQPTSTTINIKRRRRLLDDMRQVVPCLPVIAGACLSPSVHAQTVGSQSSTYNLGGTNTNVTVAASSTISVTSGAGIAGGAQQIIGVTITNEGTIESTASANVNASSGVYLSKSGTVINDANASISSAGWAGVDLMNGGEVDNYGTLSGLAAGVDVSGSSATVINGSATNTSATISASSGSAVYNNQGSPTTVNLTNYGTVETTSSNNVFAVALIGGGSVTNYGTITGTRGVYMGGSSGTVINYGTITATSGTFAVALAGGTLELENNSVVNGSIVGGGGTLLFDGSGTLDSAVSGFNTVTMQGTAWTLTNTVATTSVEVASGTLTVDGTLQNSNPAMVDSGATLTGTGTIAGSVTVLSGGTFKASAPTSSSQLAIGGALTLQNGSTFVEQLSPTAGSFTAVTGAATLGGNLTLTGIAGTYTAGTTYVILSAGSLTGTFSSVTASFAYVDPSVTYDTANDRVLVTLNTTGTVGSSTPSGPGTFASSGFGLVAQSTNQHAVAGALDAIYAAGGNTLTNTLLTASTDEARHALATMSGDSTIGLGHTALLHMRAAQDAISDRLTMADLASNAALDPQSRASNAKDGAHDALSDPWVSVSYANERQAGNDISGASAYVDRSAALSFGHDQAINREWLVGAALSGSDDDVDYEDGSSHGRSDGVQGALYARYRPEASPFYVKGVASVGWWSNTIERDVTLGVLSGRTEGDFNVLGGALYAETGMTMRVARYTVEPYIGASVARYHQNSFTESTTNGDTDFALTYDGDTTTQGASLLGARVRRELDLGGHGLTWQADLAWRHTIGPVQQTLSAAFTSAASYTFTVDGVQQARDEAVAKVGANYAFNSTVSAYVQGSAVLGKGERLIAGTAGVRWLW
ncbi:autotransporter outer membrane beta-barrel domain-containing protein [Pararobbsia silviterrae]|uniref:Autotransporter domain-containing protein n=1 Tax=Pararobbsia silviterrae TaxID=1792498 RepID=A0A494Y1H3_9BURK|nr:autotransporter outer membrane beta-barrel domain-containing protein [Pararobbsia silviterrae]RKP56557.1 autotransporter domain-containing protein [Pararobbsia silviterrae]